MTGDAFRAFLIHYYAWFGLAGSLLILLAMLAAGLLYRGKAGERYSPLNHYISELGEVGVSRLAWAFNLALISGGLVFIPFLAGMGLALGSLWGKIALAVGTVTALACMGVGFVPMNHLKGHGWVAMTYFRSGLVTVLLFSLAVFLQSGEFEIIPKESNVAGLISVGCYAAFLLIVDNGKKNDRTETEMLDPETQPQRPKVSKTTIMEWAVFFSTILWFFVLSLFSLR